MPMWVGMKRTNVYFSILECQFHPARKWYVLFEPSAAIRNKIRHVRRKDFIRSGTKMQRLSSKYSCFCYTFQCLLFGY